MANGKCPRPNALAHHRKSRKHAPHVIRTAYGVCGLRSGFTLVEMLIVVTIVGLLASVVIPTLSSSSGAVSLEAMARTLAADLRLARQSAVQYNGDFAITLDLAKNSYTISQVVGSSPELENVLAPSGSGNTIDLDTFGAGRSQKSRVVLGGAALKTSRSSVVDITFHSTGGTGPSRPENTVFWLTENTAKNRCCILVTVSWITGAVTVGDVQSFPASLTMPNF
ncbi:MAG: Tfp pilus assembly protein FimT/FimU [Planctomycetaceae bacterium]